jgi:hypothetical protein
MATLLETARLLVCVVLNKDSTGGMIYSFFSSIEYISRVHSFAYLELGN